MQTYALGLLLERVSAETTIRIVVLDPNSDYVRLAHVREGAHPLLTARYARVTNDVAVWRDGPEADRRLRLRLRLRFADLDPSTQAAVLGLDPVRDREEYAALIELLRLQKHGEPLIIDIAQLADSDLPGARALGLAGAQHRLVRLEHLGPAATLARCGAARPHGPVRERGVPVRQPAAHEHVLPHAAYAQMGVRVSEEGGADVPAAWATPRARSSWERHRSFGFDSKMYRPRRVVPSAEIRPNVAARPYLSPRRASSAWLSGQRRMQR